MSSVFESIRVGNHLYVFYQGDLIYKQWNTKDGKRTSHPSRIFNSNGFPSEWIVNKEPIKNDSI